MSVIFLLLLLFDGLIIAAAYARYNAVWASDICTSLDPLCGNSNTLIIAAIIVGGLYFLVRA